MVWLPWQRADQQTDLERASRNGDHTYLYGGHRTVPLSWIFNFTTPEPELELEVVELAPEPKLETTKKGASDDDEDEEEDSEEEEKAAAKKAAEVAAKIAADAPAAAWRAAAAAYKVAAAAPVAAAPAPAWKRFTPDDESDFEAGDVDALKKKVKAQTKEIKDLKAAAAARSSAVLLHTMQSARARGQEQLGIEEMDTLMASNGIDLDRGVPTVLLQSSEGNVNSAVWKQALAAAAAAMRERKEEVANASSSQEATRQSLNAKSRSALRGVSLSAGF